VVILPGTISRYFHRLGSDVSILSPADYFLSTSTDVNDCAISSVWARTASPDIHEELAVRTALSSKELTHQTHR
jgi:hypothetical protein